MRKLLLLAALCGGLLVAPGCKKTTDDVRPASYDALALATGHWEWVSSSYQAGPRTPASVGCARQLVFGPDGQLTVRRTGQADYHTSYRLSMGRPAGCPTPSDVPLLTFANEPGLFNNNIKAYRIGALSGRQQLDLTGEMACVDGGAYETYYWVAE